MVWFGPCESAGRSTMFLVPLLFSYLKFIVHIIRTTVVDFFGMMMADHIDHREESAVRHRIACGDRTR
jgi:hypothetical protein